MAAALGLGAGGIISGGVFATSQAAAATGGSVVLATAPLWGPAVGVGCAAGIGAALAAAGTVAITAHIQGKEFREAMGPPTGLVEGRKWVMAAHNWGAIELYAFETEEAARASFERGKSIRRILMQLTPGQEKKFYKVHGCEWREMGHAGHNSGVDEAVRERVKEMLAKAVAASD